MSRRGEYQSNVHNSQIQAFQQPGEDQWNGNPQRETYSTTSPWLPQTYNGAVNNQRHGNPQQEHYPTFNHWLPQGYTGVVDERQFLGPTENYNYNEGYPWDKSSSLPTQISPDNMIYDDNVSRQADYSIQRDDPYRFIPPTSFRQQSQHNSSPTSSPESSNNFTGSPECPDDGLGQPSASQEAARIKPSQKSKSLSSKQDASSSEPSVKRGRRATQACKQCRASKSKCSDSKPCDTCTEAGVECEWYTQTPSKTEMMLLEILGIIKNIGTRVDDIAREQKTLAREQKTLGQE